MILTLRRSTKAKYDFTRVLHAFLGTFQIIGSTGGQCLFIFFPVYKKSVLKDPLNGRNFCRNVTKLALNR